MSLAIEAALDKIIVKPIEEDEVTEGGLILPENSNTLPQECGEVVSCGFMVKTPLNKGDVVMYHKRAGQIILHKRDVYKVIKEEEVYGITEKQIS